MRVHRLLFTAMVALLLLMSSAPTLAQDRPDPRPPSGSDQPDPASAQRIDLAAIALDAEDMPSDVTLAFEAYLGGSDVASQLFSDRFTEAEIADIGLLWYYESQYETDDQLLRIRTYIEQFADDAAVERGFDLLEDEGRPASGVEVNDDPGFDGIGQDPSELTTITYEESGDEPGGTTIDVTFRVANLLVGVAIDSMSEDEPSLDELESLAVRLEERAEAVLAGDDLPGIDPALSAGLLDYGDALVIQEGYLGQDEFFAAAPDAEPADGYESGYIRMVVLGLDDNPDLPLPFVTTAVYRFSSESDALGYLTGLESVTPEYADRTRAEIGRVPGTDASRALSYTNPYEGNSPDSVLIAATIENLVITLEVVGAESLEQAQVTALALLEQQVPCIASAEPCGTAELPPGFASPVG